MERFLRLPFRDEVANVPRVFGIGLLNALEEGRVRPLDSFGILASLHIHIPAS